jgi:hypothetical protein
MRVVVLYILPTDLYGPEHFQRAVTFAESMHAHPAGFGHRLVVVSNGGKPSTEAECLFSPFDAEFFPRANIAKDIGSFQHAAREIPCDLMVFLGGSTYIRGANWLLRIAESFSKHGEGLYGCMANTGVPQMDVSPHIRTTGFWMPPALLNRYPERVTREDQRYPFEHGPKCLTSWVAEQGLPTLIVTWDGEYPMPLWGKVPGGFHLDSQEGLIVGDRLSRPPYHFCP